MKSVHVRRMLEFHKTKPYENRLIYLNVGDWDNPHCGLYSYNGEKSEIEELLVKLAELSLTQRITQVSSYNSHGIIDVYIKESKTGQTNIDVDFMDACVKFLNVYDEGDNDA